MFKDIDLQRFADLSGSGMLQFSFDLLDSATEGVILATAYTDRAETNLRQIWFLRLKIFI